MIDPHLSRYVTFKLSSYLLFCASVWYVRGLTVGREGIRSTFISPRCFQYSLPTLCLYVFDVVRCTKVYLIVCTAPYCAAAPVLCARKGVGLCIKTSRIYISKKYIYIYIYIYICIFRIHNVADAMEWN